MLSYRHSFHAGNFADIIKHVVLIETLQYLTQKDKPFEYIDTHAGAGLYDLGSSDANKLKEYQAGIAKLSAADFPELQHYFDIIQSYNQTDKLSVYPGSPAIAKTFLRRQDRAWLYELHPRDYKSLHDNLGSHKKIGIFCQDGFQQLKALLPPASRRALVLIDPSYEVKFEYDLVFDTLQDSYKKFATGSYLLWYPVVDRQRVERLEKKFIRSGIKNIQRFELGVAADSDETGMTASGMFVINPPWTLYDRMAAILPRLAKTLGNDNEKAHYKCDVIAGE
ncbi:MAG: 23S rRNA (adenine2030-N6)-methyltransferase [Oceanicoccus sp.]